VTHWKALFPTKYLASHDLKGADVTLTVRAVVMEVIESPRGDETRPVVYFKETAERTKPGAEEKRLILNRTNASTIAKMHGNDADQWKDKQVTLFSTTVSAFGDQVEAIRIRPFNPTKK
jgi:hypothetical protein